MAFPLNDTRATNLNSTSPVRTVSNSDYDVTYHTAQSSMASNIESPPSSPFVANVVDRKDNQENISPFRLARMSTNGPIDREPTSALKMLKSRPSPTGATPRRPDDFIRSPRKLSAPEKRFPVKPSSPQRSPVAETTLNIEEVLRENEGLTKAIEILEDEESDFNDHVSDHTSTTLGASQESEELNMDDTVVSTFSTFSAIPDMTSFAKLGHTPSKSIANVSTPRRSHMSTPPTARRSLAAGSDSSTPRTAHKYTTSREDTNLILDFTEQFNGLSGRTYQNPARLARQSPLKSGSDSTWGSQTPSASRNMSNLLDFDIPPAPTPRSMPSITPRELESLKSTFLSEISSLKASLSGKDAEVQSLKTAVVDAEKRVGESMEQVREERSFKEQLAAEKEEWDNRGREMEAVLRNVKEEIVHGEREIEELEGRLEESERRREMAEIMAQDAQRNMASMRAGKGMGMHSPITPTAEHSSSDHKSDACSCGGKTVEAAVEKVSRELHTLYKEKHETKVAALKKSYERRWEKKVKELESQVEDLTKDNEELKLGRDTTITRVALPSKEELEKQAARDARAKQLEAELEGLSEVVKSVKQDNVDLRNLLDEERVEKGKLKQAVDDMIPLCAAFDEMLAGQIETANNTPTPPPSATSPKPPPTDKTEHVRRSLSRASGLRAPGSHLSYSGESRIGRGGFGAPAGMGITHERTRSGSSHGSGPNPGASSIRPGSGMGYAAHASHRSGIMSSIEKMGSYKGREQQLQHQG